MKVTKKHVIGLLFAILVISTVIIIGEVTIDIKGKQFENLANSPATNFLTSKITAEPMWEYGSDPNEPQILSQMECVDNIGGKMIIIKGGSVSGGIAWSHASTERAYGYSSGIGRVEVYDINNEMIAEMALPCNSMISLNNVDKICVYAEVPLPYTFTTDSEGYSYSGRVISTVMWN